LADRLERRLEALADREPGDAESSGADHEEEDEIV
jgi:hypothetical protein